MKRIHIIPTLLLAALPLFLLPTKTFAVGSVTLDAPKQVNSDEQFVVHVSINTADTSVNAISGEVSFPQGLSAVTVLDGSSLVSLWIVRPHVEGQSVSFAGIVPGGFAGTHDLFDVVVTAVRPGPQNIRVVDLEMRANDKDATKVPTNLSSLTVNVSREKGTTTVAISDSIPPEPFTVTIQKSPDLFEGKPFASFSAVDKQSGIEHYEAAYSYWGQPDVAKGGWKQAASPLEIESVGSGKLLFVKAVDHSGNIRIAKIATPGYYLRVTLSCIIVLIILWVLWALLRRAKKKQNTY